MPGLGDKIGTVRDWMTRDPVTVPPDFPVKQVIRLMRARRIRHILVMEADRLVGIASDRDVRRLLLDGQPSLSPDSPVGDVMTTVPVTVSPAVPLAEAARALLEMKIGALPVVENDRPVGVLTKSDALEALLTWIEGAEAGAAPSPEGKEI